MAAQAVAAGAEDMALAKAEKAVPAMQDYLGINIGMQHKTAVEAHIHYQISAQVGVVLPAIL